MRGVDAGMGNDVGRLRGGCDLSETIDAVGLAWDAR